MDKKILWAVLLFLLALPLVSPAGEEKEKEEWRRYHDVTLHFGGGVVYWHRDFRESFSIRVGVEQAVTRRFSLTLSAGCFSRTVNYDTLMSFAESELLKSWYPSKGCWPPQLIRSTVREYTLCLDAGFRYYIHRSPDGKKAFFLYATIIGLYDQTVTCKFLILDTGIEEEHSGKESLIDLPFAGYPVFDFGGGAKFHLKDNLYLETLIRTDAKLHMVNLYFGLSRRF
jgi:hypothetical protein